MKVQSKHVLFSIRLQFHSCMEPDYKLSQWDNFHFRMFNNVFKYSTFHFLMFQERKRPQIIHQKKKECLINPQVSRTMSDLVTILFLIEVGHIKMYQPYHICWHIHICRYTIMWSWTHDYCMFSLCLSAIFHPTFPTLQSTTQLKQTYL